MRLFFTLFILLVNLVFPLTPASAQALQQEIPVVAESKIVKAVEVKGNKTIGVAAILSRIKTRVGQDYLASVISDDLKRLYIPVIFLMLVLTGRLLMAAGRLFFRWWKKRWWRRSLFLNCGTISLWPCRGRSRLSRASSLTIRP